MSGCTTCGGFGNRHDPIAHDFVEWARRDCEQRGNVYEAHEWTIGPDGDECAFCYVTWEEADEDCKRCTCDGREQFVCHDFRNEPHLVGCPRWGTPKGLPLHRTEAGYPRCATCDGGGCPDCTDPA